MKICSKCKIEKYLSEFNKHSGMKDGYQYSCKECSKKVAQKYKHKSKEYAAKFRAENKEICNSRIKEWKKENKGKVNSYTAKRHASKMNRTPIWTTKKDLVVIESKYAMARWLSEVVGIEYHVDHIFPLQGDNVSGLHVPDNLRIIPAVENMSKGNRYNG